MLHTNELKKNNILMTQIEKSPFCIDIFFAKARKSEIQGLKYKKTYIDSVIFINQLLNTDEI